MTWFEIGQQFWMDHVGYGNCRSARDLLTDDIIIMYYKTAELSQRRPRDAPNGCPGKFRESWLAHGYFSRNL